MAEYATIPRDYRQIGTLDGETRLSLFLERLADYDCLTHVCHENELRSAIRSVLEQRALSRMLVAPGFPSDSLPDRIHWIYDESLSYKQVETVNAVLTMSAVAIAVTGTIILQEGRPGQGRRVLSLLPDYHLCIVHTRDLVETVPEGFRAIEASSTLPITTISGPSATADIEMVRIRGVHGPRTLEVIVVQDLQS